MMQQWSISSRAYEATPVYLNVYSFCHCCNLTCGWLGIGVYHTAIQIFGIQFMFHGWAGNSTGVSQVMPKTCPYRFEQQIHLGNIDYTFADLDRRIIEPLKKRFISNTYDLFNNNCNHFALAMAESLGLSQAHPQSYIFRLTNCLNTLRCCIPNCVLSGRLDWFRSSEKENEQLQQIRNSQIKHDDSNTSRYQQLVQEQEEAQPYQYVSLHGERPQNQSMSSGRTRRHNIFPPSNNH